MATIIRMMYLPSRSSFSLSFEAFAFPLKVTRLLHFTVSLTDSVSAREFCSPHPNCPLRYFIQPTNLPECSKNPHYRMTEFSANFMLALISSIFLTRLKKYLVNSKTLINIKNSTNKKDSYKPKHRLT